MGESARTKVRGSQEAIAVVESSGGAIRVVRCNGEAAGAGVRGGMTLAEAKALLPSLRIEEADPRADGEALEALAEWGQAFSPIVQIEPPDALLLDVTGCQRLFKGEDNLLSQALNGLRQRGFSARGAVADTPGAAWAIAHAHDEWAVVTEPGHDVRVLARLPIESLRLEGRTVSALHAVGVETVEALMHLPRASLGARFGEGLRRRLDQALGDVPEPLVPFCPPPVLRSSLQLGAATGRQDIVGRAIEHVLTEFCGQLAYQAGGVMRVQATFYHPAEAPTTVTVDLSRPTRSFKILNELLSTRLEQVRLPAETEGVMVWTRQVEPLGDRQEMLFETEDGDGEELTDLIDRLAVRLGAAAVARVELVSDHQPERAYRYVARVGGAVEASESRTQLDGIRSSARTKARGSGGDVLPPGAPPVEGSRPLRVWSRPVEVPVVAVVPEGPPTMFRFQSTEHVVAGCVGPERVETGWWRGPHIRRDYYRVVSTAGQAFWLFRDNEGGGWFVQGVFD